MEEGGRDQESRECGCRANNNRLEHDIHHSRRHTYLSALISLFASLTLVAAHSHSHLLEEFLLSLNSKLCLRCFAYLAIPPRLPILRTDERYLIRLGEWRLKKAFADNHSKEVFSVGKDDRLYLKGRSLHDVASAKKAVRSSIWNVCQAWIGQIL